MRQILILLTLILLLVSTYMAFTVGEVTPIAKNIIYVHVPSAICTSVCFLVLFTAGIAYLRTSKPLWDYIAAASAEVGLVFATVLNATGSIFSRSFWNTWWTPSPRLVSSAVLWFLCIVYLILRASIQSPQRRGRICAVFGIIAFLDVPLVYISARFLPDMHIKNVSFESAWQGASFGLSILGTLFLTVLLIWLKTDILRSKARLEDELTY